MSQFNTHRLLTCICLLLTIGKSTGVSADLQQAEDHQIEEIVVWGTRNPFSDSSNNPVSRITPRDAESINAMTTEDLVKFEPGIIIRQRFIGDANGTMGIRGSNMFQTARSMVFADGVPLHYFLQTRWNGSPRWSLVSADEIAEISIFYGPFSAEYGGNAMAGVVNIETAIPTERNFHTQISGFQQNFDSLGSDNKLNGHKIFLSYGDKIGDFSVYGSFNRLTNDSHPQSYYFSKDKTVPAGTEATPVSGGVMDVNEYNDTALYYGNAGATEVTADQLKFKIGYEHNDWFTMVNLAFEDRESNNIDVRNYLKTDDGTPMWNGWVEQNGMQLEIESDDFAFDKSNRKSLLIGGRSRGPVGDYSYLELGISHFSILEDETLSTNANPADPAFVPGYDTSREYGDTGWSTFDIKLLKPDILSVDGLNLLAGYHHDRYELEIENSSGGKSQTQALFGQIAYPVSTSWHLTLGGRYEKWESEDGFYIKRGVTQHHPDRTENHFSPKFVLAFNPGAWHLTYSVARAYRFPIVEELFQNERTTRSKSVANAYLEPEAGLHHNLGFETNLGSGSVRLNIFNEKIKDVIFSQTGIVGGTSLRTFLPVSEVVTNGVELSINQYNLFDKNLELRLNLSYLDAEITKNDPNPALEDNVFPRMPRWRANGLLTWHINDRWNLGGGIRYASNSFGDLDNGDTADSVFGTHDEYLFVNLKTSYRVSENLKLSVGMDNVTNEVAFVHHPWPGRTLFLEASLDY